MIYNVYYPYADIIVNFKIVSTFKRFPASVTIFLDKLSYFVFNTILNIVSAFDEVCFRTVCDVNHVFWYVNICLHFYSFLNMETNRITY